MKPLKRKYLGNAKPKTEPKQTQSESFHPVELNFKEGKHLSDLLSLLNDLEATKSTLLLLKNKFTNLNDKNQLDEKLSENSIISRALITSALISYTRCFNKGARFGLTTEIFNKFEDSEEIKKVHKFITDLRSKHFAHSVNPFEQYKVAALVNEKKFHSIVYLSLFSISGVQSEQFLYLVDIAINHVQKQISVTDKIVLETVRSMSIEELNKLQKVKMTVAGPENVKDFRV
jgi:hypothetical protein